jgi:hypothetical protein
MIIKQSSLKKVEKLRLKRKIKVSLPNTAMEK